MNILHPRMDDAAIAPPSNRVDDILRLTATVLLALCATALMIV